MRYSVNWTTGTIGEPMAMIMLGKALMERGRVLREMEKLQRRHYSYETRRDHLTHSEDMELLEEKYLSTCRTVCRILAQEKHNDGILYSE